MLNINHKLHDMDFLISCTILPFVYVSYWNWMMNAGSAIWLILFSQYVRKQAAELTTLDNMYDHDKSTLTVSDLSTALQQVTECTKYILNKCLKKIIKKNTLYRWWRKYLRTSNTTTLEIIRLVKVHIQASSKKITIRRCVLR